MSALVLLIRIKFLICITCIYEYEYPNSIQIVYTDIWISKSVLIDIPSYYQIKSWFLWHHKIITANIIYVYHCMVMNLEEHAAFWKRAFVKIFMTLIFQMWYLLLLFLYVTTWSCVWSESWLDHFPCKDFMTEFFLL